MPDFIPTRLKKVADIGKTVPNSDPLTTFLVNDQEDANGFHMDWDAIKAGAHKWKGVYGILFRKCDLEGCRNDHTEGGDLPEALELSDDSKVTEIIDVKLDEATHTAYAVQKILQDGFKEKICSGEIEFVSQSIWLDKKPEDPNHIHVKAEDNYTPVHLAYVDDPAFGPVAKVTEKPATCNVFKQSSSSKNMDSEPEKKEEQQMSTDDMVKEMHSMTKEMHSAWKSSMEKEPEKQESSMDDHKKADSSKKPSYSFSFPSEKKESAMLCDLVQ